MQSLELKIGKLGRKAMRTETTPILVQEMTENHDSEDDEDYPQVSFRISRSKLSTQEL